MAFRSTLLLNLFMAIPALAAAPGANEGRFVPGSDLDGTWEGIISNGGMGLPMILVISTTAGQGTKAALDIMEQAPKDIPTTFTREKMNVFMDVPAVGGKFDGLVAADLATISGRWTQTGAAGGPVPLILHRKAP